MVAKSKKVGDSRERGRGGPGTVGLKSKWDDDRRGDEA